MTSDLDNAIKIMEGVRDVPAPGMPVAYLNERIVALKAERHRQHAAEEASRMNKFPYTWVCDFCCDENQWQNKNCLSCGLIAPKHARLNQHLAERDAFLAEDEAPEWDGEGYAEVGEKVSYNNGQYFETSTVIGRHECWLWLDVPSRGLLTVQQVQSLIQPVRSSAEREKSHVRELAYQSLPEKEKVSFEWQAHAERIIEQLYDAGLLRKAD